jgi:hypothetical protein
MQRRTVQSYFAWRDPSRCASRGQSQDSWQKGATGPYLRQFDSYHRPFEAMHHDFQRDIDGFLCLPKKAELCVNLGFGRRYAPEKSVVTHPFKLNALAILCAGSGEFMVILTMASLARQNYEPDQFFYKEYCTPLSRNWALRHL